MSDTKKYIAVDLGAESGRVMLGSVCGGRLELEDIHRFGNGPVEQDGSLRWDFGRLFSNIKDGIAKAVKAADGQVCGIGVDSWGVDFGLIDESGELIENPYHYRDSRTDEMMDKAFSIMGRRKVYDNTGIQFMQLNTVYQLLAAKTSRHGLLGKASKLIFMSYIALWFLLCFIETGFSRTYLHNYYLIFIPSLTLLAAWFWYKLYRDNWGRVGWPARWALLILWMMTGIRSAR